MAIELPAGVEQPEVPRLPETCVFVEQKNAPAPGDRDRALALWAAAQCRAETKMKTGEKETEGEKAAKRAVTGACV